MTSYGQKFLVAIRCEKGHEQRIILDCGYNEAMARDFGALMDGSAFPYPSPEAEAASMIGKCSYGGDTPKDGCGAKFKCEVTRYEDG
jgi:hypothetical protein